MSDYYGRGIVRSNQESTNLRTYIRRGDVTSAESIKTNKNIMLPAAGALRLVEKMNSLPTDKTDDSNKVRMEFDDRDKFNITIITKNAAYLYACRPLTDRRAVELPYLSLYECFRYWRTELVAYVISIDEIQHENSVSKHVSTM